MSNVPLAQWLLTRISTQERASAIVGDLLEQRTSAIRFWLAFCGVVLAFTWRWIQAIVLSAAAFSVVLLPYSHIVLRHTFGHPHPWMIWAMCLFGAATSMGTSTAVAASLYGMRDRLTAMCASVWTLLIACALCVWLPRAPWVIASVLAVSCVGLLLERAIRGLFLCALASAAAYGFTYMFFGSLLRGIERRILVHVVHISGQPCCNDVHALTRTTIVRVSLELSFGMITWLTSIFAAAIVLTRLRPMLLRKPATKSWGTFNAVP